MADFSISVRDVVKRYKIRHSKGRTLKELFLRQSIFEESINALDHVSFDVKPGITMGVIGSNGSGKSTMLKLIAGTSHPTSGDVVVNGRVSALLQLGAGFHPDFTGRENVFLDGAIMGLSRRVVEERFDEIVAFAEMEEFIDQPAKTYSSGMYMRLAFAVAVNVDPEILLIDEVFAVGDEAFQRKCLERIDNFKSEGKTILFVSHGMAAVRGLCDEAVWINKGKLSAQGMTDKVIDYYLWTVNQGEEGRLSAEEAFENDLNRWGTRRGEITKVEIFDGEGEPRHLFSTADKLKVRISYRALERLREPVVGVGIHRTDGVSCFGCNTSETGGTPKFLKAGEEGDLWFEIDNLSLLPGDYQISTSFHDLQQKETFDYHDRKYRFKVLHGPAVVIGLCNISHRWVGWPNGEA